MTDEELKVCVIGLGEVGLPTALYYQSLNIETCGYDLSEQKARKARELGLIVAEQVPNADVYIICVDTPAVVGVCSSLPKTPNLVSIESTVPIGTTRRIWEEVFHKKTMVCHLPQRFWARDPQERGVRRRRPLGAPDNNSLAYAKWFYERIAKLPIDTTSTVEIAELTKVAENAWTYVWVAFAEELAMICFRYGLDYNELRFLIANASDVPKEKRWPWQPQYNLAKAEQGIGGTCLPLAMDLMDIGDKTPILKAAKRTDAMYKEWLRGRGEE